MKSLKSLSYKVKHAKPERQGKAPCVADRQQQDVTGALPSQSMSSHSSKNKNSTSDYVAKAHKSEGLRT